MNKIEISKELLGKIIDSLSSMIDYADDGTLDENDEEYKEFFKDIKNACIILEKLNSLYSKNK